MFISHLRPKRNAAPELCETLPLPVCDSAQQEKLSIEAIFTGYSVEVVDPESIKKLCLNGGFGQGLYARAFPACVTNPSETVRKSKRTIGSLAGQHDPARDNSNNCEPLSLFLEEAFFLMHKLNILKLRTIYGKPLSVAEAFERFRQVKKDFVAGYCGYLYLKAKNWVVKSGIKFGGDFVIYVKGPQFYHASYIVLIREMLHGKLHSNAYTVDGLDFQGFNRVAETTAKDILFLEVHYPDSDLPSLERLQDVRVGETFTKHHNYIAGRNQQ
ncbi:tRNA-splicing endonuclease subunit Sen2 [Anopheles cruzii]|uniref:tRNA-splicing endonuclease subunit Sen2 n=1 Tax=Anopheles cruzii TaxID=68878 RepID=UPI0022EC2486|nr:tRNA-splicing endonuclease subunit Sen2 [Anopheles cruzii]